MIPEGYRKLEIDEVVEESDLYFSSSNKWSVTPIFGFGVLNNGVIWIRRI